MIPACSACNAQLVLRWNRFCWVSHCTNLTCSLGGKLYIMHPRSFSPLPVA